MSGNRSFLPLHNLNIKDTTEDHSVSSLGETPNSSDEDMDGRSSSSGGSYHYDSTRLLRDIKEALESTRYPGTRQSLTHHEHHQQHHSSRLNSVSETQAIYRRESNKINQWHNDDFLLVNNQDEQMIQEQFKILQQIERDKALSKNNNQAQANLHSNNNKSIKLEDAKLAAEKSDKDMLGYSDPKLREWEGKIVKLLDEQHSQAAMATGDALYIKCTGCSSTLGFPRESTHLYCPLCHTLHKLR